MNPRQRLVIAGGAGPAIMQDPRLSESAKLSERVIAPGLVPQSCLNGLLEEAQCIVLPLTQGGNKSQNCGGTLVWEICASDQGCHAWF